MPRDYAWRRHQRTVHGLRRLKEDQAQHGSDRRCPCFAPDAARGRGVVFARFADHPTGCSGSCCGNRRKWDGPTLQERRADPA